MENREDVEILKEQDVVNEEVVSSEKAIEEDLNNEIESQNNIINNENNVVETTEKKDSKVVKFIKGLLASTIDQIVVLAVSLVLLVVIDFLIKFIGFYVAERQPMFLIIVVIVNILYGAICNSTKLEKTLGKRLMLK